MEVESDLGRLRWRELAELAAKALLEAPAWFVEADDVAALASVPGRSRNVFVTTDQVNDPSALLAARLPAGGVIEHIWWLDLAAEERVLQAPGPVTRLRLPDLTARLHADPVFKPWLRRVPSSALIEPERLWAWLAADLVAEQYPRLARSSGDPTKRMPLRQVFVDLPLQSNRHSETFAARMAVHLGVPTGVTMPVEGREHSPDRRVVLIGGPGQGKTTLAQYLCQAHRVSLLRAGAASVSSEAQELLCDPDGLTDSVLCKRIPIFVVLHRLADALAREELTVETWIARQANERIGQDRIDAELVGRWLDAWPSLVVFDGLDEVPPSANREQLLGVLRAFLAVPRAADLAVIVSTRPQGYRGELADWRTLNLSPLQARDALRYGERLLLCQVPHDAARRNELLRRLGQAANDPTTRHLTSSPLQVLILTTLVEQSGSAPRERWRLFREYFRIILDRERERNITEFRALFEHQKVVERLHVELGYRAQLAGELTGATSDGLPRAQLREIVEQILVLERHDPAKITEIVAQVEYLAFNRLVFLVGAGDENVRFDVRSLQEFFAAERLFIGAEALVPRQLQAIAASAHWRNVLLFAVGRIAAERDHLLDEIDPLCDVVDAASNGLGGYAGSGMRLALWLLTDGALAGIPAMVERLLRRVVDRVGELDEGDDDLLNAAAGSWREEVLLPTILSLARQGHVGAGRAWMQLASEGDAAARAQASAAAAARDEVVVAHLVRWFDECWGDWEEEVARACRRMIPLDYALLYDIDPADTKPLLSDSIARLRTPFGAACALRGTLLHIDDAGPSHPTWELATPWRAFAAAPGPDTLVAFMDAAAAFDMDDLGELDCYLPWPLSWILHQPRDTWPDLRVRLLAGELGGGDDWDRAFHRWVEHKVSAEDLVATLRSPPPFPPDISVQGIPPTDPMWVELAPWLRALAAELSDDDLRAVHAWITGTGADVERVPPAVMALAALRPPSPHIHRFRVDRRWWTSPEATSRLAELAQATEHATRAALHTKRPDPSALGPLLGSIPDHPWLMRWLLDVPSLAPGLVVHFPAPEYPHGEQCPTNRLNPVTVRSTQEPHVHLRTRSLVSACRRTRALGAAAA